MRPLHFIKWWLIVGWLLVLAVVIGSLTAVPKNLSLGGGSDKLLHFSAYFALMMWFGGIYRAERYWIVALGLLGVGVALEIIQGMLRYRQLEYADIAANSAGLMVGLVVCLAFMGVWCQWLEQRLAKRVASEARGQSR